jgi:hypothetical protein
MLNLVELQFFDSTSDVIALPHSPTCAFSCSGFVSSKRWHAKAPSTGRASIAPGARARNERLWEGTVKLARLNIRRRLSESPNRRRKIDDLFESAYQSGRIPALATTKLNETSLPTRPPWSLEQIMEDSFMPGPGE